MHQDPKAALQSSVPARDEAQPGLFLEDLEAPGQPTDAIRFDPIDFSRPGRPRAAAAQRDSIPGEPLQLPIDQLEADPTHPRGDYPPAALADLAKDVAERGVLQAIVVAPAKAPGRFRICLGVQRWRAARMAGLTTVPVAVRMQPCEAYDQVAENLKRHGLTPLELAQFIRSRTLAGESNATIAKKLAMDPTTVAHHLSLLDLPPVLADALAAGRCTSPRTLHELSKLHEERPVDVAALLAGDAPVTRDAVSALRCASPSSSAKLTAPPAQPPATAGDAITTLFDRSQLLCDRLDRLLARLAGVGPDPQRTEQLSALRQRLAALAQRLGG